MIFQYSLPTLPTTVSTGNTSVFAGSTPYFLEASDKPTPICRKLAGNSAYFRQPLGKTRPQTLVGSTEVPRNKKQFEDCLGGNPDRDEARALAEFEAERAAIQAEGIEPDDEVPW